MALDLHAARKVRVNAIITALRVLKAINKRTATANPAFFSRVAIQPWRP
jgi:hypothetical protein